MTEKPLTKWAKGAIADRWGALKAEMDAAEAEIKTLKEEFDRRGLAVAQGDGFLVVKRSYSFDGILSKAELLAKWGAGWVAANVKPMSKTEHRVSALGAAAK
jgi:hypothetical protein